MNLLIEQMANGLGLGLTYALVGIGYNLSFGVLRVVNLAYGEVFLSGALGTTWLVSNLGWPAPVAICGGILIAIAVGTVLHVVAVRPLGAVEDPRSQRHIAVMASTMGASMALQQVALLVFGPNPVRFPEVVPSTIIETSGLSVSSGIVVNLGVSALLLVSLLVFLKRTRMGLRLRAIASNRTLAAASGIRVSRDQCVCIGMSSAIAGLAAILVSGQVGAVTPFIGLQYGLKGLVAMILARGSMVLTALVAIGLGVAESLVAGYASSSYRDAIVFTLLVIAVACSPRGAVVSRA